MALRRQQTAAGYEGLAGSTGAGASADGLTHRCLRLYAHVPCTTGLL